MGLSRITTGNFSKLNFLNSFFRNSSDYVAQLEADLARFQRKVGTLNDDLDNERARYRRLKRKYDDLSSDCEKLKANYTSTLKVSILGYSAVVIWNYRKLPLRKTCTNVFADWKRQFLETKLPLKRMNCLKSESNRFSDSFLFSNR
jgi:hypothetical protein